MHDQLSLLVIDDDALDRMAVQRALRSAQLDYKLTEAFDRASALDALDQASFDVILLDYRLPGSDGMALLRETRERGISTPIVMLTGQGDEQLAIELLRAGATDYLPKSAVSPDVLNQSIQRALRLHRAERIAAQAESALRKAADRQRFLAEASQYLVESLDTTTILERLVDISTRAFADGSVVYLLDQVKFNRAATTARDQQLAHKLEQIEIGEVAGSDAERIVLALQSRIYVIDSQQPIDRSDPFLAAFAAVGACSLLVVPLTVRGQALGALAFISIDPTKFYTTDDQVIAEELAHRTTVALDNARLYREAQEAVRVRDAFLSVAAHELKTPLTTLYGNVQLLQRRSQRDGTLGERDQRSLKIIFEQTARLNKMISALLDLSRLQMGQFTIQPTQLDLVTLAQRVVDELQPSLDRHTVTLLGAEQPLFVMGDELRLEQVLQNLIQNAIKYSPAGGNVVIQLARTGDQLLIVISDQGIGIPQTSMPNLFSRFFRASNVHEHRISGIGVGLYVVNEIVTLHGGQISVESTEGVGTTFTVSLPVGIA